MRDWLARCESLSLQPLALTPDVLALPWQPPAWSAVQVDEQWLIRTSRGAAWRRKTSG